MNRIQTTHFLKFSQVLALFMNYSLMFDRTILFWADSESEHVWVNVSDISDSQ